MPTVAERLSLLLGAHGHVSRDAGELCGLDHTTIIRMARGETENPATLAKVAEGYGVPLGWLKGEADTATDFTLAVLCRPVQDRVTFIWDREQRVIFALEFLRQTDPTTFTAERLAGLLNLPVTSMQALLRHGQGQVPAGSLARLCAETGLPLDWFRTGLVGGDDEDALLVGLTAHALSGVGARLGMTCSPDEVHELATVLLNSSGARQ